MAGLEALGPPAIRCGVSATQQVRGLGRVEAPRPPVQAREVLAGRRLRDTQFP